MKAEIIQGIHLVAPEAWDRLVSRDDPFVEHAFLSALERSGTVGPGTGWEPYHALVWDSGRLVGAMPLYLKDDSFGEYVFDWGWAEGATRAGISYYPKLVSAVPFTPVGGRRLLLHPAAAGDAVAAALIGAAQALAHDLRASSLHVLFLSGEEQLLLSSDYGFLPRLSFQFHWNNRGYRTFDDFLASLRSTSRKSVRRERARAAATGLTFRTLQDGEADDRVWSALYRFYRDTTERKWGRPYLNRAFFHELRCAMGQRVVVPLAEREGWPAAGALCVRKGSTLYGRYWGSLVDEEWLHFELCYYRPIELCIEQGWKRFEAGAQGIHKLRRGLMPSPTYSAHWFPQPAMHAAVRRYVLREAIEIRREMAVLAHHGPFRRDGLTAPPA
jgi:hypothetical protein